MFVKTRHIAIALVLALPLAGIGFGAALAETTAEQSDQSYNDLYFHPEVMAADGPYPGLTRDDAPTSTFGQRMADLGDMIHSIFVATREEMGLENGNDLDRQIFVD